MVEVKTYSKSDLAKLYNVGPTTFRKWLEPFMPDLEALHYQKDQKILKPKQVKLIFDKLGKP